tara:strand:+ start:139 stop:753 length:615 start_codon:yes stop_codon:yes gene_type:complete
VHRLVWKNEINSFRKDRSESTLVKLPDVIEDIGGVLFKPVWVEGEFLHDKEMYLAARSYRSNPGYHVITPFKLLNGSMVLINRGWIPLKLRDPKERSEGQYTGTVRVQGLITGEDTPGWMTPDNVPTENFWYWVDLSSLTTRASIEPVNFIIDADSSPNPGGFPIGGQTRTQLRNEHFHYAVIWYVLALCLGGISFLMLRRSRK